MLPVTTSSTPPINISETQTPVPQRLEIHHTNPLHADVGTDSAAAQVFHPPHPQPPHEPNPMSSHEVKETPIQIFQRDIKTEHAKKKAEIKEAGKEYKDSLRNIKIQKIAFIILAAAIVIATVATVGAACVFCPPAGAALAVSLGVTLGYTALLFLGLIAVENISDVPEDKRETLEKNVNNLNAALQLFESHPKKTPADNSSFEEFLGTLPAITKDGEKVYELQHLDKYVSLFHKNQKIQRFDNFRTISSQLNSRINTVKQELATLGVNDPSDSSSIKSAVNDLEIQLDYLKYNDEMVELKSEFTEKIADINELSGRFNTLNLELTELQNLYTNNTRESLQNEMKPERELIEKAIAEQKTAAGMQLSNDKIQKLEKDLIATKTAYIDLSKNSPPSGELPAIIQQREQNLEKAKKDMLDLEEKLHDLERENNEIARMEAGIAKLNKARINLIKDKEAHTIASYESKLNQIEQALKIKDVELDNLKKGIDVETNKQSIIRLNAQKAEDIKTKNQLTREIIGLKNIIEHENKIVRIESEIQAAKKEFQALKAIQEANKPKKPVKENATSDDADAQPDMV